MIPKTIHYCWFGRNPKPVSVLKCIESWKTHCPDYTIVEWNEDNFDIFGNRYCEEAYYVKKWAFATDYARLWIVYHHGGIYLDTDVEVIRPLDPLLLHDCFIGRQPGFQVNTGAGFGAVPGHPLIKIMLDDYADIPFILENGEMDLWTCPHRNSRWLFEQGLDHADTYREIAGAVIYPSDYFSPLDAYSRQLKITPNTFAIHHCDATWNPKETKWEKWRRRWIFAVKNGTDYVIHTPHRVLRKALGPARYVKLKEILKGRKHT